MECTAVIVQNDLIEEGEDDEPLRRQLELVEIQQFERLAEQQRIGKDRGFLGAEAVQRGGTRFLRHIVAERRNVRQHSLLCPPLFTQQLIRVHWLHIARSTQFRSVEGTVPRVAESGSE